MSRIEQSHVEGIGIGFGFDDHFVAKRHRPILENVIDHYLKIKKNSADLDTIGRTAEARQRYQEYLDRDPWGEHAQEALERLG